MGEAWTGRRSGRHGRSLGRQQQATTTGEGCRSPPVGSQSTARTGTEASRTMGAPLSPWPGFGMAQYVEPRLAQNA
jgi:hypothetical protein